jgi:hypothetical protein
MRKVLISSCGIAAAALGAAAISAEPLEMSRTAHDAFSIAAGEGAVAREPSAIEAVRGAQAPPPAREPALARIEPSKSPVDDPNRQAAVPAAEPAKPTLVDDSNVQTAAPAVEPGKPVPADDPNGQAAAPAAEPAKPAPADDPNGQAAAPAVEPAKPVPADDPNGQAAAPAAESAKPVPAVPSSGQAAPANRRDQSALVNQGGRAAADDPDGDADDVPGTVDDDRGTADDPN